MDTWGKALSAGSSIRSSTRSSMDEIVVRGMAKWPNVPAVYGWLSLDRRGQWLIKGERISNPLVTEFIGRNYARDERGCWYFQNGPQRVFVDLDYAPLVYRVTGADRASLSLETHSGKPVASLSGAWLDEQGSLLLASEHDVGNLHDRDLERLLPALIDVNGKPLPEAALDGMMELVQQGKPAPIWLKYRESILRIEPVSSSAIPRLFGFVALPEPPAGEEVCR
jgi:Protein of unknown function (DUF2946)